MVALVGAGSKPHRRLSETGRVARLVYMDQDNRGFFVDIVTGERVEDHDAEGVDVMGSDEHGVWWGTRRAAWWLSEQHYVVEVWGHIGSEPYQGHFIGTVEEAVDYCERHMVTVGHVCSGKVS